MLKKWIFLLVCLGGGLAAYAQETDSLPSSPPVVERLPVTVVRHGTDHKINEGFGAFGDPISNLIFYAPKIGEDVLIADPSNPQIGKDFYENPPFQVEYSYPDDAESRVPFGKSYTVSSHEEGELILSFAEEIVVPFGRQVAVNGHKLRLEPVWDGGQSSEDVFAVAVTYTGSSATVASFRFKTPGLEPSAPLEQLKQVVLTYTRTLPIDEEGTVIADGFTFSLNRNPASAYAFAGGKVYSFRVTEIYFLPIVVLILLLGALIFTLYFRFVNIRKFRLAIDVVRGKYSDPHDEGEVSHFQALTAALSGTVGLGNIAGVAIAISIGGAGATLWMILAGLLGMSSKFVECTLGVKYRTIDARGEVSGGPMYYLSRGLAKRGLGVLGKVFAGFFAIMCIGGSFGGGNMFQVNQAFQQFAGLEFVTGTWIAQNGWMFGIVMALLVAVVIIGGIRSIAKVTDKVVPFMCGIYVLAALVIIGMNITAVPGVFGEIITGAFAPTAIAGGFVGVLIQGFRRGAFSNEAGVGSASIAHSAVKTDNPASEGIVALLEPFIDTVVVCTMTALVIIITGNHLNPDAADGVALTSRAFSSELPFFKYILSIAVILFAFSTMITWSYYGLKSWTYLFGGSRAADITYKVLFCFFIVVGAAASLGKVTDFSDAMIFAMAFPNIIGLVILVPEVRDELNKYIEKIRSGEIIRLP